MGSTNSQEALEIFRTNPERFDLVITDQTMPQLTGLDLSRELLQINPQLPVIICTGYSESLTPEKARTLGIGEIIMKPIIPQQLAVARQRELCTHH